MEHKTEFAEAVLQNVAVIAGVTAAVIGTTIYRWLNKSVQTKMLVDLNQQSIEMEDGVHRSPLAEDPFSDDCLIPNVRTLYDGFQRGLRLARDGCCLGSRPGSGEPYEWLTYDEVFKRAKRFGSGLMEFGLQPNPENFVGIYSINRVEWTVAEQACNTYSLVVVPLYDSLGPNASSFIINQAQLSVVVCDTAERAHSLLDKADKIPSLRHLIIMTDVPEKLVEMAKCRGIYVVSFNDVELLGEQNPRDPVPPKPSDLATICYTSGTTGDPKGVMLSHANITADVDLVPVYDLLGFTVTPEDVYISYLPLPHMFERCMQFMMLTNGGKIGFYRGDVKQLMDDIQELKPTIFASVPRVLNRLYDKVISGAKESRLKSFLLNMALRGKEAELKRHIVRRDSIWDMLVLRKVQNILGGRIKCVITGSAPISPTVLQFLRCALGCYVLEGYGQTETTTASTLTIPGDFSAGHVGGPMACNYLKLTDVPEMDYYASEGKGEICAKGSNVFMGYYKCPEQTAQAFDDDGWLHTGDIGTWLPNGTLKIIGRRKHIFKLAQGEYIAPLKIENIYARSQFVSQIFVQGNSLQAYPMAVVVPDLEELIPWAIKKEFGQDLETLCSNKAVKNMILADIAVLGKAGGLRPYEQVKDILLVSEAFTVENGLLTPTFKNKRPVLTKLFNERLDRLYERHS